MGLLPIPRSRRSDDEHLSVWGNQLLDPVAEVCLPPRFSGEAATYTQPEECHADEPPGDDHRMTPLAHEVMTGTTQRFEKPPWRDGRFTFRRKYEARRA
jgi:hypothetical protein